MLIYCMECENGCSESAEFCPKCGHPLKPAPPAVLAPPVPTKPQKPFQSILATDRAKQKSERPVIICKVCDMQGNSMVKTRGPRGNALVVALGVFLAGLFLLIFFFWTIFLGLMGGLMMFAALFMGNGPKVWKCRKCQAIIPRA